MCLVLHCLTVAATVAASVNGLLSILAHACRAAAIAAFMQQALPSPCVAHGAAAAPCTTSAANAHLRSLCCCCGGLPLEWSPKAQQMFPCICFFNVLPVLIKIAYKDRVPAPICSERVSYRITWAVPVRYQAKQQQLLPATSAESLMA